MKNALRMSLPALLLACFMGTAHGQDWPQWRGQNRDGKAAGFKDLAQRVKAEVENSRGGGRGNSRSGG